MMTDDQMLKILESGDFERFLSPRDTFTNNIIKNRIKDIPNDFFEPRICIDVEKNTRISLIQFSLQTSKMNAEQKRGLMERYSIDPYDVNKLQSLLNSIRTIQEVGNLEPPMPTNKKSEKKAEYGFSLASDERLSKAYMLLVAYQCFNSTDPLRDVEAKLKEDGTSDKYSAKSIVGIIEHTNTLMIGKSDSDKQDFYMHSISGLLNNVKEMDKKDVEIPI